MSKVTAKINEEFIALIPPTIYFYLTLNLIALIHVLMLSGTGIAVSTAVQIAVRALVLGQAVLIADLLPVINRYCTLHELARIIGRDKIIEMFFGPPPRTQHT